MTFQQINDNPETLMCEVAPGRFHVLVIEPAWEHSKTHTAVELWEVDVNDKLAVESACRCDGGLVGPVRDAYLAGEKDRAGELAEHMFFLGAKAPLGTWVNRRVGAALAKAEKLSASVATTPAAARRFLDGVSANAAGWTAREMMRGGPYVFTREDAKVVSEAAEILGRASRNHGAAFYVEAREAANGARRALSLLVAQLPLKVNG